MTRRWIFFLPIAVLAVLAVIFALRLGDLGGGEKVTDLPSMLLDAPVPELALLPLAGREAGFGRADLLGQVSLLNIWGSWCVACLAEHPLLMEVARVYPDIPVFGMAWRDTPEKAAGWLERHGNPYARTGLDPHSEAAIALGVTGAPETFVIDAAGVVRYKQVGPITLEAWEGTLLPLIRRLQAETTP